MKRLPFDKRPPRQKSPRKFTSLREKSYEEKLKAARSLREGAPPAKKKKQKKRRSRK